MPDQPKIVGLGEPLIEMVRLPNPVDGQPAYVQGFGGDTSTAIIAAARQGAHTGFISALGADMFGNEIRDLWKREGVDFTHVLSNENAETGVCFIDPDPVGRRFTYARAGSAARLYRATDIPESYIADADILHFSGVTLAIGPEMRDAAIAAVDIAQANGTLVSFDLNHRPALWSQDEALGVIHSLCAKFDIVFPSDDESLSLFGDDSPDASADRFLNAGAKIVVAKRGSKGAYLATKDARHGIAPAPSNPVDASGAGDSFAGAFLARYLETNDPHHSALKAAEVAAATVSGLGAVEPIPRR